MITRTCKRLWFEPVGRTPFQVFLFLFFAGVIIRFRQLKYKTEAVFFIFAIILTAFMISMGSYVFAHYFLLFVPLFAFPFAAVYHFIKENFIAGSKMVYCFFVLLLLCGVINDLKKVMPEHPYHKHTKVENLVSFINKNSEKTDKITVVGNDCWIYILSGRESVSKYAYQFPIAQVKQYGTAIAKEYINDVKNETPRIIITRITNDKYRSLPELKEILDNQYDKAVLPDMEEWNIYCWLRKQ